MIFVTFSFILGILTAVMLISGVQQNDSIAHADVSILFQIL